MEPEYISIAQKMMAAVGWTEELPTELRLRLDRVAALCEAAGGGLVSRQAIAVVVEHWVHEAARK